MTSINFDIIRLTRLRTHEVRIRQSLKMGDWHSTHLATMSVRSFRLPIRIHIPHTAKIPLMRYVNVAYRMSFFLQIAAFASGQWVYILFHFL